jgi:hypothetical protein
MRKKAGTPHTEASGLGARVRKRIPVDRVLPRKKDSDEYREREIIAAKALKSKQKKEKIFVSALFM